MESEDRMAIDDLLAAYARAITRRRPAEVADLFEPDANLVVTGYGTFRGRESIVEFLGGLLEAWDGIVHLVHQGTVDATGDQSDDAEGWWAITEEGVLRGDGIRYTGMYHDSYRRGTDGRWRFARRRYDGLMTTRTDSGARPWPLDID